MVFCPVVVSKVLVSKDFLANMAGGRLLWKVLVSVMSLGMAFVVESSTAEHAYELALEFCDPLSHVCRKMEVTNKKIAK